jgi:hypothetical protein
MLNLATPATQQDAAFLDGIRETQRLWVLKKSRFVKIGGIREIENVYQNGDRRL